MKMTQAIRRVSAITIAAALGLFALIPADAVAEEVAVMRHTTRPLPGYGTLTLEIWNDGTDVQVIGLDAEGRIVLAREGRMSSEPTFEGTGAIEGMLPAEQLSVDSNGTLEHERCATPSCARQPRRSLRSPRPRPANGGRSRSRISRRCRTWGAWCGSAQRSTSCARRHGPSGRTNADRRPRVTTVNRRTPAAHVQASCAAGA